MSNPNSDEAILQHYGETHVAHVEEYHLHNSRQQARYLDYYKTFDREMRDGATWGEAHRQANLNMPENFK